MDSSLLEALQTVIARLELDPNLQAKALAEVTTITTDLFYFLPLYNLVY